MRVILHCAATPDYKRTSEKFDRFGFKDIDTWHRERGFNGCGYHRIIRRTGEIEKGRPIGLQGAHTSGENEDSIGICLIGTRWPTEEQVESLKTLYRQIRTSYKIDYTNWYGHCEYNEHKTCPGVPMSLVRALLRKT